MFIFRRRHMNMPPLYHGSDQLEELIHAQQWKQVLSLCEKRQKKGDQTDELKVRMTLPRAAKPPGVSLPYVLTLQVVKIHICLRWPDHTRRQQGLRDLEALLARETPVTDIKALGKLEGLVRQQGEEEPKLHGIWERAAGSSPRDIKLLETWFRTKFSAYQYQDAQKANPFLQAHGNILLTVALGIGSDGMDEGVPQGT